MTVKIVVGAGTEVGEGGGVVLAAVVLLRVRVRVEEEAVEEPLEGGGQVRVRLNARQDRLNKIAVFWSS